MKESEFEGLASKFGSSFVDYDPLVMKQKFRFDNNMISESKEMITEKGGLSVTFLALAFSLQFLIGLYQRTPTEEGNTEEGADLVGRIDRYQEKYAKAFTWGSKAILGEVETKATDPLPNVAIKYSAGIDQPLPSTAEPKRVAVTASGNPMFEAGFNAFKAKPFSGDGREMYTEEGGRVFFNPKNTASAAKKGKAENPVARVTSRKIGPFTLGKA